MPILNIDLAKDCDIIVKMISSVEESESVRRMVEGTLISELRLQKQTRNSVVIMLVKNVKVKIKI